MRTRSLLAAHAPHWCRAARRLQRTERADLDVRPECRRTRPPRASRPLMQGTKRPPPCGGGGRRWDARDQRLRSRLRAGAADVPAPGRYEVAFTNTGTIPHDITFAGGEVAQANGGETSTVEVDVPADGLTFICSVPGHEPAGMTGSVTVEGASAERSSGGGRPRRPDGRDRRRGRPQCPGASHLRPGGSEAPRGRGPRHRPGDRPSRMMTVARATSSRSGRSTGPSRARSSGSRSATRSGSTSRTRPTNKLAHSIDFHASQVAWNDEMTIDQAGRGDGLRVDRRLRRRLDVPLRHGAGAPPHRQRHVRHGHRGASGRPARRSTHEFAIVQSEWYLGPQGQPAT